MSEPETDDLVTVIMELLELETLSELVQRARKDAEHYTVTLKYNMNMGFGTPERTQELHESYRMAIEKIKKYSALLARLSEAGNNRQSQSPQGNT